MSEINLPDIPLEEFEVPQEEFRSEAGIKNKYEGSIEYGVIGSGQCGGRLAKSFFDIGYKKALAINTAEADLIPLELPKNQKMLIGDFQGSGKSMIRGAQAASNSSQRILDMMRLIFGNVKKIIISVGFGGGTGAGSLSILIDLAAKYLEDIGISNPHKNVIVVAALPTIGELKTPITAKNNAEIKRDMFMRSKENKIGPIILIDNSRIEKLYRGIPPAKFWSTVNDTITGMFQMFNYLSKQESNFTTFDSEDYNAVISKSGIAVMGATKISDNDKNETLSQALQDNFKKTLLCSDVDYSSAKEAACVVVADNVVMSEGSMDTINYGFDAVHNLIGTANLHRGLYGANTKGIRAYTLITGMNPVKVDEIA